MSLSSTRGFTEFDVLDQTGRCVIVTGANCGIGFEISRVLAARGARVLMACRDQGRAEAAMARIRALSPHADLVFLPLDLADLGSVRAAAACAADEPRVDVLINNAGVMTPPLMRTKQGFELQFGVNHLGCFALTGLLLPKFAEGKDARVVVTSSMGHRVGRIDWDDLNAERSYGRFRRYAASKLANALFVFELDRRLRLAGWPVTAIGCHPGFAATELGRYSGAMNVFLPLVGRFLNSAAKGAWPALQAATGTVTSGGYYGPTGLRGIRGPSGEAYLPPRAVNRDDACRLWDVSVAMTGIDPGLTAEHNDGPRRDFETPATRNASLHRVEQLQV